MPGEKPATREHVVSPVIIVRQSTSVGTHSARVAATAIRGSVPLTQNYFEYGTTASFGNTTPLQNIAQTGTANFSATLSGLESGTKYYIRVIVKDAYSASHQSGTASFTTLSSTAVTPAATAETPTGSAPAVTKTKPATKAEPGVAQTNETASVFFAPTAGALIGWFLAIIFFITSLVMGMMLVRRNHKNNNKGTDGVGNREYQEFPIHPLNNTTHSKT